jgi:SPRY domain-containing SOCS box protein 1/4
MTLNDPLTMWRRAEIQSTDCVRGKAGHQSGLHLYNIIWPENQRGTHAGLGVATETAPLQAEGYRNLVGLGQDSWGWDLGRGKLYHNSRETSAMSYPGREDWTVPDNIYMALDMEAGTVTFLAEGRSLGVAFTGLRGLKLHPIISTVWGDCLVRMRYLGSLEPSPLSLQQLCREEVRDKLDRTEKAADKLGLPTVMKKYIKYEE